MATYAHVSLVSASEANDLITERDPLILDVRTPEEYAEGHIQDAINIPLDDLNAHTASGALPDKNRDILVYCLSGTRSSIGCGILSNLGYDCIYDMIGGLKGWTFGTVQ